jgi:SPP1 family predicted phage head-tail adaptor
MYNNVISLIAETEIVNEYGSTVKTETTSDIFCELKSIGQTEFYQAQTNGMKPEIKFVIADYLDYQGEENIAFDGMKYKILRTYRTGNELEITCYGGVRYASA